MVSLSLSGMHHWNQSDYIHGLKEPGKIKYVSLFKMHIKKT